MTTSRTPLAALAGWRLAILLAVAWMIVLSLTPFEFSGTSDEITARLRAAFTHQKPGGFAVGLIHFLGFAAAGFLGFNARRSQLEAGGEWRVIMMIIVGCMILEAAKLWVPTRHAMVFDLLMKILGAASGAWLAARKGLPGILRWFPRLPGKFKVLPALILLYLPGGLPFALCIASGGPLNPAPFVGLFLATLAVAPLSFCYLGLTSRNFRSNG